MRHIQAQEGHGFLVWTLFALTVLLVAHTSLFGQDKLIVTPDKPKWGDTLRIELHPAKERGRLYAHYKFRRPLGESRRGWNQLSDEGGIYKCPPIILDINTIDMSVEIRGRYYVETACPLLPYRGLDVYTPDGKPADQVLGDESRTMFSNWYDMAREDKEKAKAYIRELEEKRPQTLPDCYVVAQAYFSLGEDEKALRFVRKMFEMDPSSPFILETVGGIFRRSPAVMNVVQNYVVRFLENNAEKPISWETLARRFDSIPDSVGKKVLDAWHSAEPDNPIPLYHLARLSWKARRLDQALSLINRATALEKQDFLIVHSEHRSQVPMYGLDFHKLRGDIQHERGDLAAAIRDYEQATSVPAETAALVPIYLRLGSFYSQCGQVQESQLCWFRAYIAGDTTDSESILRKTHSQEHPPDMSFSQHLRHLHEKTKSDYENAPDFEKSDASGQRANLSDNRGKLTVLYFWSPGCPPCVDMIPCLNQIRDHFINRDVEFWAIGHADEQLLTEHPFKFRIIPASTDLWQKYRITATPQSFVIGPEGRIIYRAIGGSESVCDTLKRILERLALVLE